MGSRDRTPLGSQEYVYGEHRREKTFNDNVHGHITLHRASVAIVDTPEFQRLRNLKQLGLTYYIYPGASHNRFEHSLGVAHLASEWGRHLIGSRGGPGRDGWTFRNFEPEDRINLTVLQIAGLCHDLGHGPFSHVFEKELLPKLFPGNPEIVREWHHETMSNKIFDFITSEDSGNDIDLEVLGGLNRNDTELVKDLMHGSSNPAAAANNRDAPWLFDIVANKRNGVDVDKFDYLLRDSKMCGVTVPLDPQRLMMFSRQDRDKGQVIFKMTEYGNLAVGLFQSRAEMHRRVYTHQKVKSIEFMVCDALALAQEPLGLREAVADGGCLSSYLNLDDSLLQRLQALRPEAYENSAAVVKAQQLLKQLARRQLYKFVQEVSPDQLEQQHYKGLPTAEEIIGYQSSAQFGVELRAEDVILCETHIDQGMKRSNPMDLVRFYQTTDAAGGDASFIMEQQQVSSMLGTVYQDKKIRVYSKDPDKKVCAALKYAFEKWSALKLKCPIPGTPWRQQPRSWSSQGLSSLGAAGVAAAAANGYAAAAAGGGYQAGYQAAYQAHQPGSHQDLRGLLDAGRFNGEGDGDGGGAARLFMDGGPSVSRDSGAAAAGGIGDGAGSSQEQPVQQPLHMGSGGRSRKRSLTQDMTAASQQSQYSLSQQQGCLSQNGLSQQQQQQQQSGGAAGDEDGIDGAEAVEPPAKHSRANGSGGSSSAAAGSSGGRSRGARGAGAGAGNRVLPGIAEEAGEGAPAMDE